MRPFHVLAVSVSIFFAPLALGFEEDLRKIASSVAANVEKAKLRSVTVVDFTDLQGKPTELGRFLAQELSDKLVTANPAVAVVDRANVQFLIKESKLSAEGFIDPAFSRKLGKLAGVDAIVIGTTTPVSAGYRLSVRAIGVDSGRVVSASSTTIDSSKELDQLFRRGVGKVAATSPSSTEPTGLATRIRSESFRVEARELVVHNRVSGTLALTIQNLSGEQLAIGVLERSLLIGSCAPLPHDYDPRINLPYVKLRGGSNREPLRALQANERMMVTGSFNTQDDTCTTLREGGERQAEISFQLVVSDGNDSVRLPVLVPASIIRRLR